MSNQESKKRKLETQSSVSPDPEIQPEDEKSEYYYVSDFMRSVTTGYKQNASFSDLGYFEFKSECRVREAFNLFKQIWRLAYSYSEPIELVQSIPCFLDRLYGLQYIPDSATMVDFIFESIRGLIRRIAAFFTECKAINALPKTHPYINEGAELFRVEERHPDPAYGRFVARLSLGSRCVSTERDPDLAKKVNEWIKTGEFGIGDDENPLDELIEELKKWYCSTVDGPLGTSMNRYKWKYTLYSTAHYNRDAEDMKLAVRNSHTPFFRITNDSSGRFSEILGNSDCRLLTTRLWLAHYPWKIADLMQDRSIDVYPLVQTIMSVAPLFPSCAFNLDVCNNDLYRRDDDITPLTHEFRSTMDLIVESGLPLDRYTEEFAFNWNGNPNMRRIFLTIPRHALDPFVSAQIRVKTRIGRHLLLMKTIIKLQRGIDIAYTLLGMISDMVVKIG